MFVHLLLFGFVLIRKKDKGSSDESESSDENEEKAKESSDEVQHPLVQLSRIDPKEIPDVPSNKFLMRGSSAKNENEKESKREKDKDRGDKEKERDRNNRPNQRFAFTH